MVHRVKICRDSDQCENEKLLSFRMAQSVTLQKSGRCWRQNRHRGQIFFVVLIMTWEHYIIELLAKKYLLQLQKATLIRISPLIAWGTSNINVSSWNGFHPGHTMFVNIVSGEKPSNHSDGYFWKPLSVSIGSWAPAFAVWLAHSCQLWHWLLNEYKCIHLLVLYNKNEYIFQKSKQALVKYVKQLNRMSGIKRQWLMSVSLLIHLLILD